jgi:hypothetical protein
MSKAKYEAVLADGGTNGSERSDEENRTADVEEQFHEARPIARLPSSSSSSSSSPSSFRVRLRSFSTRFNRYYVVLFIAILAISCAGTLLRNLPDTPPLLKAFWRLFFMSIVLAFGSATPSSHRGGRTRDDPSD